MWLRTYSAALTGIEARVVDVEVDFSPAHKRRYDVVGLPDAAVRESGRRIEAALSNCGYALPRTGAVTINLAPADLRKEGSCFDLPIALALIGLMGHLPAQGLDDSLLVGELSLDGKVRPVRGALAVAQSASQHAFKRLFVPSANAGEAALVRHIDVWGTDSLAQVVQLLSDPTSRPSRITVEPPEPEKLADLSDVRGQSAARRALEVACAGGHNLLMVGPPGSGKTMLARRIPSLLPPLEPHRSLESTVIHSVCRQLRHDQGLLWHPPFRAPHHTVSPAGLVGGGPGPNPGEVTLAHNGVLFLDELPEFSRSVLETLRQPLEGKFITVSRARATLTFPADFLLVASMNPCPCGFLGDCDRCHCTPAEVRRYRAKISGPLLDRIDIQIQVPPVEISRLRGKRRGESSRRVAERVLGARRLQSHRYRSLDFDTNAGLHGSALERFCGLSEASQRELETILHKLGLSARAYHRILRVARTVADLEGRGGIARHHLAEAIRYRSLDRRPSLSFDPSGSRIGPVLPQRTGAETA